jgi:hypothetical protein
MRLRLAKIALHTFSHALSIIWRSPCSVHAPTARTQYQQLGPYCFGHSCADAYASSQCYMCGLSRRQRSASKRQGGKSARWLHSYSHTAPFSARICGNRQTHDRILANRNHPNQEPCRSRRAPSQFGSDDPTSLVSLSSISPIRFLCTSPSYLHSPTPELIFTRIVVTHAYVPHIRPLPFPPDTSQITASSFRIYPPARHTIAFCSIYRFRYIS